MRDFTLGYRTDIEVNDRSKLEHNVTNRLLDAQSFFPKSSKPTFCHVFNETTNQAMKNCYKIYMCVCVCSFCGATSAGYECMSVCVSMCWMHVVCMYEGLRLYKPLTDRMT